MSDNTTNECCGTCAYHSQMIADESCFNNEDSDDLDKKHKERED